MHADSTRLDDFSGYAIGCAFSVLDTIGAGFALAWTYVPLVRRLRSNSAVKVYYNDAVVGELFADLFVEDVLR